MTLPEVVVMEPEGEALVGAGTKKELVTVTDAVNERERVIMSIIVHTGHEKANGKCHILVRLWM